MSADVTILMPVRNGEKFLKGTLDDLMEKIGYGEDIRILAANHGSIDSTHGILETYRGIEYIDVSGQNNLGKVRNILISLCTTKYFTFLDCDDILDVEALRGIVDWMDSDFNIDAVYASYTKTDGVNTIGGPSGIKGLNGQAVMKLKKESIFQRFNPACWGKVYRTSSVRDQFDIKFSDTDYGEDVLFTYSFAAKKNIMLTSVNLVDYRLPDGNPQSADSKSYEHPYDIYDVAEDFMHFIVTDDQLSVSDKATVTQSFISRIAGHFKYNISKVRDEELKMVLSNLSFKLLCSFADIHSKYIAGEEVTIDQI